MKWRVLNNKIPVNVTCFITIVIVVVSLTMVKTEIICVLCDEHRKMYDKINSYVFIIQFKYLCKVHFYTLRVSWFNHCKKFFVFPFLWLSLSTDRLVVITKNFFDTKIIKSSFNYPTNPNRWFILTGFVTGIWIEKKENFIRKKKRIHCIPCIT